MPYLPFLPAGLPQPYAGRALVPDDAKTVTDLIAACELVDLGEAAIELVDLEADWARPSFDLASESIGVTLRGDLVAVAEVHQGERAEAFVLPEHRGHGLGTALLAWTWAIARRHGAARVGQTVADTNPGATALFRAHDYARRWTSWLLEVPPGETLRAAEPPAGFRIRQFVAGQDEHAAYRVIEDAFAEWPDRLSTTYEDWEPRVLGRPDFEPELLLLAAEHGTEDVVGACHLVLSADGTGWVHQLAVRADRRGLGLATVLLTRAFEAARARGATRLELSTDSRTSALGLYEHLGMRVRMSFTHWSRSLS